MIDRKRVDALLDVALDLPEAERAAFLDGECENAELRQQLERLLAASERETSVVRLQGALLGQLSNELMGGLRAGDRLGAFRIAGELGKGGMAVVYLAERADGQYEQRVALKILERPASDARAVARFERERQILASLEHAGIARIVDGGMAADGRPWFAMEHVEGARIDVYCDEHRLDLRARLGLFLEVARAVSHAHRQLVVHRDIKPSNILVGRDGAPKLLDFGIAGLVEDGDAGGAGPDVTRAAVPMTPQYASPEQASGGAVTTSSDIYQLGLLLRELLSSGGEPGKLPQKDLDTIVETALRREPERRYESASRLAEDVERYLAGRPITARADSLAYRGAKFASRNRWAVAAAALGLVAVVGLSLFYAARLRRERDAAEREAEKARQVALFLTDLFKASDPFTAKQVESRTARQLLDEGAERLEQSLASEPEVRGALFHTVGTVYRGVGALDPAVRWAERAVEQRTKALGSLHPQTVESRLLAIELISLAGRYAEALEKARLLLPELERASGPPSPLLAHLLEQICLTSIQLERLDEAETAIQRALEIRQAAPSPDPRGMSRALSLVGGLRGRQGDFEGAVTALTESIRIIEAVDPAAPSIANSLGNLASSHRNLGHVDEARAAYAKSLELLDARLQGDHPQIAIACLTWATLEIALENVEAARRLIERGLPMAERTLGPRHSWVAHGYVAKGRVLVLLGDPRAAIAETRRGREILAATGRPDAPVVLEADQSLAIALREAGELAESAALLEETLARAEPALPRLNVVVPNLLQELATTELARGRLAAAEAAIRRCLDRQAELWPGGHPDRVRALTTLAEILERKGELAAARAEIETALASLAVMPDAPPALVDEARARARRLYERLGLEAADQKPLRALEAARRDAPR